MPQEKATMPCLDYGRIREAISLQRVLELIGYRWLRKNGTQHCGRCPLQCGVRPRACSFYLKRNLWYCHKCSRGGNQLDLFAAVYRLSLYPAAVKLCAMAGIDPPLKTGDS